MTENRKKHISKFLSLILRHKPETINLILDKNGWAFVSDILSNSELKFTRGELEEVVATNDKKRFSFSEDKTKIRANQGHSIDKIDLNLKPASPPLELFHGTVENVIPKIRERGLKKMRRQHVHLSKDRETAIKVGSRRGKPIIITIRALEMWNKGYRFYKSENGVWLTDAVPSEYIDF